MHRKVSEPTIVPDILAMLDSRGVAQYQDQSHNVCTLVVPLIMCACLLSLA